MDCEDIDDILENPNVQYREMKEIFIKKCRAEISREDFGSDEVDDSYRFLCDICNYLRKTKKFSEVHRELQNTVTEDNIDIVRYLIWSMPSDLRDKLLDVGDVGDTVKIEDSYGEFSTTTKSSDDVLEEMEEILRTYNMNLVYDSIEREQMEYESDNAHSSKEDKESVTDESEYESDISNSSCDNFE